MLNIDLIQKVLIVAIASGILTTSLVQKIKESIKFKESKILVLVAFIVSIIIGTLFALSFSDLSFMYCLWCGFISFIGADVIYKAFEDKIFKPFNKIYDESTIKIPKENEIK